MVSNVGMINDPNKKDLQIKVKPSKGKFTKN